MTTNFDDYLRELEARATDEELAMLDKAREAVQSTLKEADRKIKRRERIDSYVDRMTDYYGKRPPASNPHYTGKDIVTLHPGGTGPLDHDGPCVEIAPRHCGGMRFTTLLLKGEIWGHYGNGQNVTDNPLMVKGWTDDEIIDNFISYIDGWIHFNKESK